MKKWKTAVALLAAAALFYFIVFHWSRFLADFWPFDNSRVGPNLTASIVQYAVLGIALYLLYPPFRRAVELFTARHVDDLKAHISSEHAKIHARIDETHARLDHVIKHSKGVPDWPQTPPESPVSAPSLLETPMQPAKPSAKP